MLGSECNLKIYVPKLGYLLLLKSRTKSNFFYSQLNGNFNDLHIIKTKYDIKNRASALETTRGLSYIVSKCHEHRFTNGLKFDRNFYPPSVNSAFNFIAMASLTEISKRKSTKLCQTVQTVNRANNLPWEKSRSSLLKN